MTQKSVDYGNDKHLKWIGEGSGLADGLFDVLPLLCCDGWVNGRTLVRHQDPEQIPEDPKATWERGKGPETSQEYKMTDWKGRGPQRRRSRRPTC